VVSIGDYHDPRDSPAPGVDPGSDADIGALGDGDIGGIGHGASGIRPDFSPIGHVPPPPWQGSRVSLIR
jgi:hypothetical protein